MGHYGGEQEFTHGEVEKVKCPTKSGESYLGDQLGLRIPIWDVSGMDR